MRDPRKPRARELAPRGAELGSGDLDDPVKPRGQEVRLTKANATGTWMFASSRARCDRSAIHAFDRKRPSRPITTGVAVAGTLNSRNMSSAAPG
jgi:predicted secreted protein